MRLQITGADLDIPRLITAYGKVEGAEYALVLRPQDGHALVLRQAKGEAPRVWVSNPMLLPRADRSPSGAWSDAPGALQHVLGAREAGALVDQLRKDVPKAGPAALRGTWKGTLEVVGGIPVVKLERKVATYGVLRIESRNESRTWSVSFERQARWFSPPTNERGGALRLADAIQKGLQLMTGLVAEACTVRDTQRRVALDTDYAALHPPRPRTEPKDPTTRYRPRGKFSVQPSRESDGWAVVDEAGTVVEVFGKREKGKANKLASALTRGKAELPHGPFASGPADVLDVPPTLQEVEAPEVPSCPSSVQNIASAVGHEAAVLEDLSKSLWGSTEAPALLERAASLIRHAESLVRSPLCVGDQQRQAFEALRKAADAYSAARSAYLEGEGPAVTKPLKVIAQQVSLAAARAAKACAGQGKAGRGGGGGVPKGEVNRPPVVGPSSGKTGKTAKSGGDGGSKKGRGKMSQDEKDALLMGAFKEGIGDLVAQLQKTGGLQALLQQGGGAPA